MRFSAGVACLHCVIGPITSAGKTRADARGAAPSAMPAVGVQVCAMAEREHISTVSNAQNADTSSNNKLPPGRCIAGFKTIKKLKEQLKERLDELFVTVNTVTGDIGIKQAQDSYQ